MKLTDFPECNVIFAEFQSEYNPLPAKKLPNGHIFCCWKLDFFERLKLLFTGKIWHQVLTFNEPLQPQLLTIDKPEMRDAKYGN